MSKTKVTKVCQQDHFETSNVPTTTSIFLQSHLSKLFIRHGIRERKVNQHVITLFPVDRRGHTLGGSQLQRINDTNNLCKVPSRCCRIRNHESNGLVWFQDIDRSHRQRQSLGILVGFIENAQLDSMLTGWITKERVSQFLAGGALDIVDPSLVRI